MGEMLAFGEIPLCSDAEGVIAKRPLLRVFGLEVAAALSL